MFKRKKRLIIQYSTTLLLIFCVLSCSKVDKPKEKEIPEESTDIRALGADYLRTINGNHFYLVFIEDKSMKIRAQVSERKTILFETCITVDTTKIPKRNLPTDHYKFFNILI